MFHARNVNIFQRAIIINVLVLSKVWYASHTYPLSVKHARAINKIVFPYIWNSAGEFLKRNILYRSKECGGRQTNIFFKAKS